MTEKLLQELRDHLESVHTGETPHDYFSKLKRAIHKAVKESIFALTPLPTFRIQEIQPK